MYIYSNRHQIVINLAKDRFTRSSCYNGIMPEHNVRFMGWQGVKPEVTQPVHNLLPEDVLGDTGKK